MITSNTTQACAVFEREGKRFAALVEFWYDGASHAPWCGIVQVDGRLQVADRVEGFMRYSRWSREGD